MNSMNELRLNDVCEIFSGYAFNTKDMVEEGTPILKIGNINEDKTLNLNCDCFYPKNITKKLEKYILLQNDFLICMTGATIGKIGKTATKLNQIYLINQRVGIMRSKENIDNNFLYYVLCSNEFRKYVELVGYGAAQANISASNIGKFKIDINIDMVNQKKIGKILSNYDELIETNNQRIKILENTAQELYKEWFVRFRYPGYEKDEFENGIPKKFIYRKFSEIYDCVRGVSYSTEEIECDDGENLINLKNIQSYGGFRRDGLKKYSGKYKSNQLVKYNDLIMGVTDMTQDRRTVGSVALVPNTKGVISADLIKLESKINNIFSCCLFKFGFYSKMISQFGNGANVIHLKPQSIKNQKILLPNDELIDRFVNRVESIFDQIEYLNLTNDNLVKQRDSLLPRLMSGKLSVEGKEII